MSDDEKRKRATDKIAKILAEATVYQPPDDRLTEDFLAMDFAACHAAEFRYCHSTGAWFRWRETHWARQDIPSAYHKVRLQIRQATGGGNPDLSKSRTAAGVERFCQADPVFAVTSATWDTDPFLIATPEGTVELRSGTLRPAEPADYITRLTAVGPAPAGTPHPVWSRFLDDATNGDADLQAFLAQICGYALTGSVAEHALFFLYGAGGNGKSVFTNTVAGIMGEYATVASMETFSASNTDRHPTDLAMLRGARLVTASETEEGRAWAESRIKQLTGGDPISARFMRRDFFTYRPQFKLLIVGNHKPGLRNVDAAARRRFNIIPFVHEPSNPDPDLEVKLRAEWPAILRWMIEGCIDWQANRLARPTVVVDETQGYFDDQDLMGQWLAECCETDRRQAWETSAKLFESWSAFAKASGEHPGTNRAFGAALAKRGFQATRVGSGSGTKRGYRGIALRFDPKASGIDHD